ncbi:hypothetical protein Scep_014803 [Stephania cephalantha]|uniref:Uncharacterized protein n=1 Tax=Stephania cephalantha TaxID=152367 RepID=A0AAP0J421_9MAGN
MALLNELIGDDLGCGDGLGCGDLSGAANSGDGLRLLRLQSPADARRQTDGLASPLSVRESYGSINLLINEFGVLSPLQQRNQALGDEQDFLVVANLSARVGSIGNNRLGGWHSYRSSKKALNQCLADHDNYHEYCRLLGRYKANYQHPQGVVGGGAGDGTGHMVVFSGLEVMENQLD